MIRIALLLLLSAVIAPSTLAQQSNLLSLCDPAGPLTTNGSAAAEARRVCLTTAQALVSAHPQIGILVVTGNPVLASPAAGGLRLGRFLPVDLSASLDYAYMRLPNLLETRERIGQSLAIAAPAVSVDAAVGVFPGLTLTPQLVGLGAIDVLVSTAVLPLELLATRGFERGGTALGYGAGARVGLLREGFATPGASLSVLHRRVGRVEFGDVCPGGESTSLQGSVCPGAGGPGEFALDLASWSGRAVLGRRWRGFGATAGVGYDRFSGTGEYAFRTPDALPAAPERVFRETDVRLREGRWSAFASGSRTFVLTTLAVELGWMQGGEALPGFAHVQSDFRPGRGAIFSRIGGRIAF